MAPLLKEDNAGICLSPVSAIRSARLPARGPSLTGSVAEANSRASGVRAPVLSFTPGTPKSAGSCVEAMLSAAPALKPTRIVSL